MPFEKYITAYMYSLRALLTSVDKKLYDIELPELLAIGKVDLWPCTDGVVALFVKNKNNEIKLSTNSPLSKTVNDFLLTGEAFKCFQKNGSSIKPHPALRIQNTLETILHFGKVEVHANGEIYSPMFDNAIVFGWNVETPEPDEEALKDFRSSFVLRNIISGEETKLPHDEQEAITKIKASRLLEEFNDLLCLAEKEEDIQIFLKNHPEFIYPDFIKLYPKFKLGEDYVTDYVLLVQGHHGPEYVFVEIERVDKEIFIKSGQFSAPFTQAKDQLLDWDNWLTKNHAYVSNKLPNLFKPQFHLVIGRDLGMDKEQKEKICSEFSSTSRRFSTYDDLAARFKTITDKLLTI